MSEYYYGDQIDPGTRFEELIKKAFGCFRKYCDPLKNAAQDPFSAFVSTTNEQINN